MIHNFLIHFRHQGLSRQQVFHCHFESRGSAADQEIYQIVGTGVGPVGLINFFLQKSGNGPGIIDISPAAKGKAIIPVFYRFFFPGHSESIQRVEYLLFGKTKTSTVLFRNGGYHGQVVQIRENRFLTDSRNARQKRPLHERVRLKCSIEKASYEFCHIVPVTVHICLLQGRIIFVQQNDDFFTVITVQADGQPVQRHGCHGIGHVCLHVIEIFFFPLTQFVSLQHKTEFRV